MPQQDVVDTSMSLLKCPPHKQEGGHCVRYAVISERGFQSGQIRSGARNSNARERHFRSGASFPPLALHGYR